MPATRHHSPSDLDATRASPLALPQAVAPVPRKPSLTTLPPLPAVNRLLSWAHPGTSHIERCPRPIPNHSARCWMRMHTHGVERGVTSRPPTTAPTALGSPQPSCASVPVVDGHPFSILHAYGHMASAAVPAAGPRHMCAPAHASRVAQAHCHTLSTVWRRHRRRTLSHHALNGMRRRVAWRACTLHQLPARRVIVQDIMQCYACHACMPVG